METTTGRTITISGTRYSVEGPTPRFGTYVLTGPRGATYMTQAFLGQPRVFRVIGGRRSINELRIRGNRVILTDEDGELRQVIR